VSDAVYLLSGTDPVLRGEALEQLLDELVGDDDRALTVEEFTVPGRAAAGEGESDAPSGAQAREETVAANGAADLLVEGGHSGHKAQGTRLKAQVTKVFGFAWTLGVGPRI